MGLGIRFAMCAMDSLPGPATTSTRAPASSMRSSSIPLSPVMMAGSFMINIAETMMAASTPADNLDKTPMISSIPGTISPMAMIMANSGLIPSEDIHPMYISLPSFERPCSKNMIPIEARIPRNATSENILELIAACVTTIALLCHLLKLIEILTIL